MLIVKGAPGEGSICQVSASLPKGTPHRLMRLRAFHSRIRQSAPSCWGLVVLLTQSGLSLPARVG